MYIYMIFIYIYMEYIYIYTHMEYITYTTISTISYYFG